jgi:glycosyltransferase involved in cell wall biosynthesis
MAGPDVEFLGWRSGEEIRDLYQRAEALLLPGVEDFGIVPVEAQACGCPVVATAAGGAMESVLDGETGMLVTEPSVPAFAEALARVQGLKLDPTRIRQHALRFSRDRFAVDFKAAVDGAVGREKRQ